MRIQANHSPGSPHLLGGPFRELEHRGLLPDHSAVYHLLVAEDGAGHKYHP